MKTDTEVLAGAIEILEREGQICKGAYYIEDGAGVRLSHCAEGAIREVAIEGTQEVKGHLNFMPGELYDQIHRIQDHMVAVINSEREHQYLNGEPEDVFLSLHHFNDDEHTTVGDVVLAMKKTLAEMEAGE